MPISRKPDKLKEPTEGNLTRHNTANSGLQFLDVPTGDDLKIHELQLENEFLLFEAFSSLMGYLLPSELPIDLLKEAFRGKLPVHLWILQVLQLEIVAVVWIIIWAILALFLPVVVLVAFCSPSKVEETFLKSGKRWTETTLACLLHLLLILLLCPLALMLAGNEQISKTINKSPTISSLMYDDIATFIRNAHMQISFVTTSSTDIALEAIRQDLEDLAIHLGTPYQQQLAKETGLDRALLALEELKIDTAKVGSIVSDLLKAADLARQATEGLQDDMQEMARQLVNIQQQCTAKDRPLCFAVQFPGYDTTISLENITNDEKIQQLFRLATDGSLNVSIDLARMTFNGIPDHVAGEAARFVADIKSLLSGKRADVYKSTHDLDIFARTMLQKENASRKAIFTRLENVVKWDLWRWMAILVIAALVALAWTSLLCGAPCGCGTTARAVLFLKVGIALPCMISVALWALGATFLLAAGHGQLLICQPLYDHPHYKVLTELAGPGGIFYGDEGVFGDFSKANGTVRIADVLKKCQRDQPLYQTFQLQNHMDLQGIFNHTLWRNFTRTCDQFISAKTRIEVLSPGLQLNLQILASNTAANLTNYRQRLSAKERDLGSFADQLNSVARQLLDPVVSRKLDYLAFSVRNVAQNAMQRLNDLRGNILYKIATLEVLLPTLNRNVHQSLSHLKTVQFFLDNQGWTISERTRRQFTARIKNYLVQLHEHVTGKVTKEIGKCRPLWAIFHASRFHVCKLMFDPVGTIAFASHLLILTCIAIALIVIKLLNLHEEGRSVTSSAHRDSRQGLLIGEERIWTTPSSGSPQALEMTREVPTTWLSPPPRPPSSEAFEAAASSKLSALASRITGTRNPTVSSSRTPRRRHESLRAIEPIAWTAGLTTPKRWI